jgi:hypothetical protein
MKTLQSLDTPQVDNEKLLAEKHQRLLDLGRYSSEELKSTTKPVLYATFKEFISTELAQEIFGKGKSSLTKSELLEIIEIVLTPIREERKINDVTKSYNPEDLNVTTFAVIKKFEAGVKPETVANETLSIYRSKLKNDDDSEVMPDTWAKTTLSSEASDHITQLKSQLPDSATAINWARRYQKTINESLKDIRQEIRQDRRFRVDEYGASVLAIIDGTKVEKFVKEFSKYYLEDTHQPNKDWHVASLVLALTSGRRMLEIHGDFSIYQKVDNHHIKTVGLAKKIHKDKTKNYTFEHISPIAIIDVDTWLKIYNKIPESRKGLDKRTVNGTISRAMTDNVKYCETLDDLGFINLTKHNKSRGNYHNARDFYINYMLVKNPFHITKRPMIDNNYAVSLVAHEGKESGLHYNKMKVINVKPNYPGS